MNGNQKKTKRQIGIVLNGGESVWGTLSSSGCIQSEIRTIFVCTVPLLYNWTLLSFFFSKNVKWYKAIWGDASISGELSFIKDFSVIHLKDIISSIPFCGKICEYWTIIILFPHTYVWCVRIMRAHSNCLGWLRWRWNFCSKAFCAKM